MHAFIWLNFYSRFPCETDWLTQYHYIHFLFTWSKYNNTPIRIVTLSEFSYFILLTKFSNQLNVDVNAWSKWFGHSYRLWLQCNLFWNSNRARIHLSVCINVTGRAKNYIQTEQHEIASGYWLTPWIRLSCVPITLLFFVSTFYRLTWFWLYKHTDTHTMSASPPTPTITKI